VHSSSSRCNVKMKTRIKHDWLSQCWLRVRTSNWLSQNSVNFLNWISQRDERTSKTIIVSSVSELTEKGNRFSISFPNTFLHSHYTYFLVRLTNNSFPIRVSSVYTILEHKETYIYNKIPFDMWTCSTRSFKVADDACSIVHPNDVQPPAFNSLPTFAKTTWMLKLD